MESYGHSGKVTGDLVTEVIDPRHLAFPRKARRYIELKDHIIVHGGLGPGVHLLDQETEWLLTTDRSFTRFRGSFNKIVVHGTTILGNPVECFPNRIAINSAAYKNLTLPAVCMESDCRARMLASTRFARKMEILAGTPVSVDWGEKLLPAPARVSKE